jgi:class 3 adenylate cyclase/tetratricopeptide (TPR) repeat protein
MSKAENLAVMFTDIVGFTERTSQQSRSENSKMLREHLNLVIKMTKMFGGKKIKSVGDGLLLVFRSPTDAVHCGMAIHDALWEENNKRDNEAPVHVRVAINGGEVRLESGDVYGEPVNVASRIEAITPTDEIYFTESIYLAMNKAEVPYESVGTKKLKGIPDEVALYRVPRGQSVRLTVPEPTDGENPSTGFPFGGMNHSRQQGSTETLGQQEPKKLVLAAAAVVAVIGIGLWLLLGNNNLTDQISGNNTQQARPTSAELLNDDALAAEVQQLLESNNLIGLEARINARLAADPNDAISLFYQGHIEAQKNQLAKALDMYKLVIEARPELAANDVYADNLIKAINVDSGLVLNLAKLGPSQEVLDRLAQRASASGIRGRCNAVYMLRELGSQHMIDTVAMSILDMQELENCEDKLEVVKLLARLNDPRTLPVLEESIKGGVFSSQGRKNRCIRKDAQAAIEAMQNL